MEAALAKQLEPEALSPGLTTAVQRFEPISLADMNSVSLMRRVDTKYIIHLDRLPALLAAIRNRYAALEINRQRAMRYTSQYFDTADCKFYFDHHNGKAVREKVRFRSYVDSGVSFLEVKQKSAKGVTSKHRIRFAPTSTELSPAAREFVGNTIADPIDLHPTISNRFRRLTLVDTGRSERVTIDWHLSSHLAQVDCRHLNLVVVEVKQESLDRHAPVMAVLKSFGARPYRVSKYCLGMACLCPHLKSNRFKPRLLRIDKVTSTTLH